MAATARETVTLFRSRGPVARPLLDIRIHGKWYGERRILDALELCVDPREVVSLVGPSGCGKSTLLRIVAGLDADFSGNHVLDGQAQVGPSPKIGVVFQEPRLLPWLSVADNIAFSSGHRRGGDPRVARLLSEVGLAGAAHLLPKQLSGGMAQRVALARGLFAQPRLLLLDEPFSAVDAITRERLQDLLQRLTQAHGTATLLVTHDLDEAVHLSDRVLVMTSEGRQGAGHIAETCVIPGPRPRTRRETPRDGTRHQPVTQDDLAAVKMRVAGRIRASMTG
ncbi:ABC transporter ATP-binding protein [Robbsia betulipollinis]|uniref:ABC transporter ATP-binding protein n=1 Tax=Robbsia betulipollinis TaxID=2981849 RepID=UPI003D7A1003